MDSLPVEVLHIIARFLTAEDLSTCCRVCRYWRQVLNDNLLWKPHVDCSLDELLSCTPPVVDPGFSSPEPEESPLDPICHWRKAYMRSVHLKNNWGLGNYKEVKLQNTDSCLAMDFVTDMFIVMVYPLTIELYDIRVCPPDCVSIYRFFTDTFITDWHIANNKLICVNLQSSLVHVFEVNLIEKCFALKLKFLVSVNPSKNIVVGNKLLCYEEDLNLIHVWDVDCGVKLKTQTCRGESCFALIHMKTSNDIVIIIAVTENLYTGGMKYHYYLYSLKMLSFLSFRCKPIPFKASSQISLLNEYFALYDNLTFKVYNYNNSKLIFQHLRVRNIEIDVLNDCFMFNDFDGLLHLFNPSTKKLICLPKIGKADHFQVISDNIVMCRSVEDSAFWQVWKIGKSDENMIFEFEYSETNLYSKTTKSLSRVILKLEDYSKLFVDPFFGSFVEHKLLYFW